jgi:hypothetical protein
MFEEGDRVIETIRRIYSVKLNSQIEEAISTTLNTVITGLVFCV